MRIGWKPKSADPRVASVRFRCLAPLAALRRRAVDVSLFDPAHEAAYELVVLSKLYDREARALAERCRARGQRVLLDLSDNHYFNPKGLPQYVAAADDLDAIVPLVDLITVCSPHLGEILQARFDQELAIAVVEDAVETLDVARAAGRGKPGGPVHLLWFGSAGSPNADNGMRDLERLARVFDQVQMPPASRLTVLSNNHDLFTEIRSKFGIAAQYNEWGHEIFADYLAVVDAVVIPIENNPFSLCKSNNRLATPLYYGVPVLADEIPTYTAFRPYAYLDDWQEGLRAVIDRAPTLAARTVAGRAFAREHCTIETVAAQWQGAFDRALKEPRRAVAPRPVKAAAVAKAPLMVSAPVAKAAWRAQCSPQSRASLMGVPPARVEARHRIERGQAAAGLFGDPRRLGVVIIASEAERAALAPTRQSLAQQTVGDVDVAMFDPDGDDPETGGRSSDVAIKAFCQAHDWIIFLRAGDIADPSLGAMVLSIDAQRDWVGFGFIEYADGQCTNAVRLGALDGPTHDHCPVIGNAMAVRGPVVAAYPGDIARELTVNRLHLLQCWLRDVRRAPWCIEPEHLLLTPSAHGVEQTLAQQKWYTDYAGAYALIAGARRGERLIEQPGASAPFRLVPEERMPTISVIIAFRDHAALTVTAMRSVFNSVVDEDVEVILIDNQSTSAERQQVADAAARFGSKARLVDYPAPFNHSAQMNLGVDAARGDVIVLMNNDCTIETRGALGEMALWAMRPEIGTVGSAIRDPATGAMSGGIARRTHAVGPFESLIEEAKGGPLLYFVHEVTGNTFAFAAIEKRKFTGLGALDPIHFPVGYNDVDFLARASASGLRHVALGHHLVSHTPGQSRGRADESGQRARIRQRYAGVLAGMIDTVTFDSTLAGRQLSTGAAAKAPAPKPSVSSVSQAVVAAPVLSSQYPDTDEIVRVAPALPVAPRVVKASRADRMQFRLGGVAAHPMVQRMLQNPHAFRLIRGAYRRVLRPILVGRRP